MSTGPRERDWPIDDQWRQMRREHISRLEIIDEHGRAYTRHELFVDMQDDGRTLKLFVRPRKGNYSDPPGVAEGRSSPSVPCGKESHFMAGVFCFGEAGHDGPCLFRPSQP